MERPMRRRAGVNLLAKAFALVLIVVMAGCDPSSGTNQTDPHWVYRKADEPRNKVAIVFVHGIFGDTDGTWTNKNGRRFFDFLHESPGLGDKVDIFAFGFTSKMFTSGSLGIGEAATSMDQYLHFHGVDDYDAVVFVAHSMGGLVTMQELLQNTTMRRKVPLVVFFATPQEGAQITKIADLVVRNSGIRDMFPADSNSFLQKLNNDWLQMKKDDAFHPAVVCAYEKAPIAGQLIVPWTAASKNCDEVAAPIGGANHLSLVKPDRAEHPSVVVLVNALRDHLLPVLSETSWKTPDFVQEGDHWEFQLERWGSASSAKIVNTSGIPQQYRWELPDDSDLWVEPANDRVIPPGQEQRVRFAAINEPRESYPIRLRLGLSQERTVVARLKDVAAARDQWHSNQRAVVEAAASYLAAHATRSDFRQLSPTQQQEVLAGAAYSALEPRTSDLSASLRWAATVEALSTLGLRQTALAALSVADREVPDLAIAPLLRRIAASDSERWADADREVPTSGGFKDVALLSRLASQMQQVPSMRSDSSMVRGDILVLQGNSEAARQAYFEAAQIVNQSMRTEASSNPPVPDQSERKKEP